MPNLDALVTSHNKTIIRKETEDRQKDSRQCNCKNRDNCPVKNKCLTESIVYEAKIHHDNKQVKYIGITKNDFKTRYRRHILTTRHDRYKTETELSNYIWTLKNKNTDYTITWRIVQTARAYTGGMMKCNLCLAEKYHILMNNDLINKKTELLNKCIHRRNFLIKNVHDDV